MQASPQTGPVLWWGRGDPEYSRNRILRQQLQALGFALIDFCPSFSALADWEARWQVRTRPRLIWVPCFRQRDLLAACRYARRRRIPVIFDPLISAYDKQVFERTKFARESPAARRLLDRERRLFTRPALVVADTPAHADYFRQEFGVAAERLAVVLLGADESRFAPAELPTRPTTDPLEVLFFGSFIGLQGPQFIVQAARQYSGPPVRWTLLGDGPLLGHCRDLAAGLASVRFEPWLNYDALAQRIHRAEVLLGVFGDSEKAARVIPNKVCQALACGRPVITRLGEGYPAELRTRSGAGIEWVEPANPAALAAAVARLAAARPQLPGLAAAAARTYRDFFRSEIIRCQLREALQRVLAD